MRRLTDREYKSIYSKVPRICVDLVVKNDFGFLLLKRTEEPYKDRWHLAGGGVRFGESIEDAVSRICSAEIGTPCKIQEELGIMQMRNERRSGKKAHSISIVFQIKPTQCFLVNRQRKYFSTLPNKMIPEHKQFLKSINDNNKIAPAIC